jgi:inner membrane transporter RhtA
MKKVNPHLSVLAVLASVFSVQGGASIAKYLFHLLGPGGAVTLRVGIAGLILACVHRPPLRHFRWRQWKWVILYGFSIGAMNAVYYYGIQRVPLGVAVTIEFTGPLGLALISSRRATDFLWAFLAALGIVLIVPWTGTSADGLDPLGLVLVFCAGLLWALYIVSTNRITRIMRSSDAVTLGMCVAALVVLPAGLLSGDLFHLNAKLLLIGLGVAVFSSVLPFSLDLLAMKGLKAKTFSILMSLEPAVAALSGFVFLGEKLTALQCLAMVCVIVASAGATRTQN